MKILLIEDNEIAQMATERILKKLGSEVDVAGSGLEAMTCVENNSPYDLVLVDIGLPDISGFEVIKYLCQRRGSASLPAIIALTAYVGDAEKESCEKAGADSILYKPVDQEIFKTLFLSLQKATL